MDSSGSRSIDGSSTKLGKIEYVLSVYENMENTIHYF